ncbi:hypothetical protein AB0K68_24570 [Streptomyces sp. NPDC050698]
MAIALKRIAAVSLGLMTFAVSSPAFSGEISAYSSGGAAWSSNELHTANATDQKSDGHPVKAEYYRSNDWDTLKTLWEKRGAGNTTSSKGSYVISKMKSCTYINNWPDDCSGWKTPTLG